MDLQIELVLFMIIAICGFCNATVYKVGDTQSWAVGANVDYNKWTSSKTFRVGDILVFEYDSQAHNVLQVSRADFHSCDTTAPIASYGSGNDSIVIHGAGHYFYICGFVGHCQAGQKVDVRVLPITVSPIRSPDKARNVPQVSSIEPFAPSPSIISGGHSHICHNGLFSFHVGLLLIIIWAFI